MKFVQFINERTKPPPEYCWNPKTSRRSDTRNVVNPISSLERSISRVGQPQGRQKHLEGMGNGKKQRPPCNAEDRGLKLASRRNSADFPMVSNDKSK